MRRWHLSGRVRWGIAAASWVAMSITALAQIVSTPGTATQVIQTRNGLPQVNIAQPSGAGVSVNTYQQFDVQQNGAILNNSPAIIQTQQAGMINGNPNFGPGQAAKIIVNQVNGPAASQLRGYLEIAGSRAEVVLANPSGIIVDGGGFINTSRAVLTTGQPYYGADGSLGGFNVSRGLITVQGAGLNVSNVDQVELISRAVQANAAIYAKNLSVVTGANQVDHATLAATALPGEGAAPAVSVDVSQLGGMYADRIVLIGTERGVGVNNAGVLAAQAGDLLLQSNGQIVLSGKTDASGDLRLAAQDGIRNSGTTYGQQGVSVSTAGTLFNTGMLAAQSSLDVTAGSVASSGALGAGVDQDGLVSRSGNLIMTAAGQLTSTGQNVAGGDMSLLGGGIDLSNSQTRANGNLNLIAHMGNLDLAGANTRAQGTVNANVSGTLFNDRGTLSGQDSVTIQAGGLSNQSGKIAATGPLTVRTAGQVANQRGLFVTDHVLQLVAGDIINQQGTIQSAGALSAVGASLDNTAGRIVSLSDDGLSIVMTGQLTNISGATALGGPGGLIGSNGSVSLQTGALVNHGHVTAQRDLQVTASSLDNDGGVVVAGDNATIDAGAHLTNTAGHITAAQTAALHAAAFDNSGGAIDASWLALDATDLTNRGGKLTQTGMAAMNATVASTFDNTGGSLQTNGADLNLTAATLVNDQGQIGHAGNGTLTVKTGALSNQRGSIATNGALDVQAAALSNQSGKIAATGPLTVRTTGQVANQRGTLVTAGALQLVAGDIINQQGTIQSAGALFVSGRSLDNTAGRIVSLSDDGLSIVMTGQLTNISGAIALGGPGGLIGGNGSVSLQTGALVNHGNVTA